RTSTERGQVVRARLLDAAAALIAEIGWTAVTTRRLADHAGIRSGLVHYHFESLQALLRQAAMTRVSRYLAEARAQLDDGTDPAELLAPLLDQFDAADATSLLVIETYLAATRDPVLEEQLVQELTRFRGALESALARDGNPAPGATALVVLAALDGLALQKGLDPDLPTTDAVALLREILHPRQDGTPS
ncbi:MAG: TetR family transcriptional regulator, partial [Brachybacterium sp.]|uniref:TetR/AcrR family transcriptional regulator n=1 Tax=Brachybacterium sp. TaxID=1891286 RepID=UPI00264902CC